MHHKGKKGNYTCAAVYIIVNIGLVNAEWGGTVGIFVHWFWKSSTFIFCLKNYIYMFGLLLEQ